jgi:nitrite reductase (NADH) small subunit
MSLSPSFLCRADEVEEGRPYPFTVGRVKVVLVRKGDAFYALHDVCPHRMAALSAGGVAGTAMPSEVGVIRYGREGEIIRCPWHGWEFDLLDGRSLHDPRRERVRAYPVSVEDGAVYVYLGGRVDIPR